jgi:hypothetical protein
LLKDIIAVKVIGYPKLSITFEDGVTGVCDLTNLISFTGVFALLKDPSHFNKVSLNKTTGTIEWTNGADLDPLVLYNYLTNL